MVLCVGGGGGISWGARVEMERGEFAGELAFTVSVFFLQFCSPLRPELLRQQNTNKIFREL